MTGIPDTPTSPSPIDRGGRVADRWTVGPRLAVWGDLHLHEGAGELECRVMVWRYRGAEPIPRFLQHLAEDEAAWGALRHGNLVPTLDCGRITGQTTCYWVIEAPGGPSVADLLAEHGAIAPDVAVQRALQVARALLAAHAVGLAHGDLDPANVHLVGPKHRARLAWGGLATRVERSGMDTGRGTSRSIAEIAPEVLKGAAPSPASDTWALAALLFRMLTGQPPFLVRRSGPAPGLSAGEPVPGLPEWAPPALAEALALGLRADPDQRSTLDELVERLTTCELDLRHLPSPHAAWAPPAVSRESSATPATTQRTLSPAVRRDESDPALANTPPSVARVVPSPGPKLRSIVPTQPPPRASAAAAPVRMPSLLPPALLIGLAVLLGFGILSIALSWGDPEPVVIATPPPAPAAEPAPAPTPAPAVLTLRTDPPAAEVWEGDQLLGATPLELVLEGSPADPPRELELRLQGYATHTVRQPWSATPVEHVVPLQRLPAPPPPRPPAPPLKEKR